MKKIKLYMEKEGLIKKSSKKFVKKIMAGVLGACLIIFGALPATAFANTITTYGEGQIEVDNEGGQETEFKAFKIFNANKNEDGTVSNITWPNFAVRNAVINVIYQYDEGYSSLNAQDAADFISKAYKNASGELTTDRTTILESTEFLNKIAQAVDDLTVKETLTGGVSKQLDEGYWLIVTDGNSIDTDENGTSPVFTISSGALVTINEKTSPVTIDKRILNDSDGAVFTYGADAERGQSVEHKITGGVAGNIKTYGSYYYEFEDVMSSGIDYDMDSYKVTIDGADVTKSFTQKLSENADGSHNLNIACTDILSIAGISPKADSQIVLTYTVQLNDSCIVGSAGNPNDVRIIYSSNPNTNEKSETHTVRDYLYTFELHLEKKDRDTNVSLAGAKFTIEATAPDDTASKGLFVQADGTLSKTAYEFITDEKGSFNVSGLDAGEYTLHETKTPEMYQVVNKDTVFKICAVYNENGTLASLSNTVSDNADACAGLDTTDDNTVNGDAGTAAVASKGLVNVTVGNIEKILMPLSGGNGAIVLICVGVGIIGFSVVTLLIRKKNV